MTKLLAGADDQVQLTRQELVSSPSHNICLESKIFLSQIVIFQPQTVLNTGCCLYSMYVVQDTSANGAIDFLNLTTQNITKCFSTQLLALKKVVVVVTYSVVVLQTKAYSISVDSY